MGMSASSKSEWADREGWLPPRLDDERDIII